jgi:hypothetical protein
VADPSGSPFETSPLRKTAVYAAVGLLIAVGGVVVGVVRSERHLYLTGGALALIAFLSLGWAIGTRTRGMGGPPTWTVGGQIEPTVSPGSGTKGVAGQAVFDLPKSAGISFDRGTGIDGTTTLGDVRDTGVTLPAGRLFVLDLAMLVTGKEPYHLHRHPALVPTGVAARVAEGATFPVKVDPTDPSRVLIEWDQGRAG